MSKRYLITLDDEVIKMLEKIMKDDHERYPGRTIRALLIAETKRRKAPKRAPAPDPQDRREPDIEEPRDIPHPDQLMNKGVLLTQSEYDTYMELRGNTQPKG